jgi:hypothetical protein
MQPIDQSGYNAISVWFNPWMYERTEQIWSGLTREILLSITNRLSKPQRDRLWFDLNLRRTDPIEMRKRIMASYFPRTLPGLLAGVLLLFVFGAAAVSMGVTAVKEPAIANLLGPVLLLILTALATVAQLTTGSLKRLHGWVTPDQLSRTAGPEHAWKGQSDQFGSEEYGYRQMLQQNIGAVVDMATRRSPLYIFIDDLDRCGPRTVADTIEAINMFINMEFGGCVFLIALDPSTVSAHLEIAYRDVNALAKEDPASFGHLHHTGWRFMEKIIDLPIRLPRLPDVAVSQYVTGLLDTDLPGVTQAGANRETDAVNTAAAGGHSADQQPPAESADRPAGVEVIFMPDTSSARSLVAITELESLPEVHNAIRVALLSLPARNPRQTKAFINLWRFYMVLDHRTGQFSPNLAAIERHAIEMTRLVELMIGWPYLLDMLGGLAITADFSSASNLDVLLDAHADDERWNRTARSLHLDPADSTVYALRQLLFRASPTREEFDSLARRYL